MRKIVLLISSIAVITMLMGCAAGLGPTVGTSAQLYTGITGPVAATGSTEKYTKVGTATYVNILGLVAVGNAGIEKAMQNGGITKIHHVDYKSTTVLMLYHQMTIYVYGN